MPQISPTEPSKVENSTRYKYSTMSVLKRPNMESGKGRHTWLSRFSKRTKQTQTVLQSSLSSQPLNRELGMAKVAGHV